MSPRLTIRGMLGLGDNIMQRPFVRAACDRFDRVYLQTPWPQMYSDLPNLYPVRTLTRLRTQAKNERLPGIKWTGGGGSGVRVMYSSAALAQGLSIQGAMEKALPLHGRQFVWDLPEVGRAPALETGGRPIALVRPVTARAEWLNTARSPLTEYVNAAAERLLESHYVVSVAHLAPGQEWLVGAPPPCHAAFHRGEISTMDLLALMRVAAVTVGGVGWIVPAALAMRRPAFIYFGGQGAHNSPETVIDPRADASRLGFALPEPFCRCADKSHACSKVIPRPLEQFEEWALSQGVL